MPAAPRLAPRSPSDYDSRVHGRSGYDDDPDDRPAGSPGGAAGLATPAVAGPLKWHGGKTYLADRIVRLLPDHHHYVEPFAGGLAVLFRKSGQGVSEVVNDLNGDLTNFYRVLQRPDTFARFQRVVAAVPFSRVEWADAGPVLADPTADPVDRAVAFFIRCRMSLAGRMDSFTGITKARIRGGKNAEVNAWQAAVAGLPAVHARLSRVVIENRPATELIRGHDVPGAVIYTDPPYVPETRTDKTAYGKFEMTTDDHRAFLAAVKAVRHAAVLVSGYPCELYVSELATWHRVEFNMPNHAAGGAAKRRMIEAVWCNFRPPEPKARGK